MVENNSPAAQCPDRDADYYTRFQFAVPAPYSAQCLGRISKPEAELLTREYLRMLSELLGSRRNHEWPLHDLSGTYCWRRIRHLIEIGGIAEWQVDLMALDILKIPIEFGKSDSALSVRDLEGEENE